MINDCLRADPLPWLLDPAEPAVRHRALIDLLGRAPDDPEVVEARRAAAGVAPIGPILAAQHADGWWDRPGGGYGPKYSGTVWQLIFLDQLGADGTDPRIQATCDYVLDHAQAASGGFAATSGQAPARPSSVVHCLNGNLLRALIGFGRLADDRVARAIDWQVAATTGEGEIRWGATVPGPGFRCGANDGLPCAWGATKAALALARIPVAARSTAVQRALDAGIDFLLSRDPAVADYPMGYGNSRPNASWFRLGFPSGYVTDYLQVLEAVCEAGHAADPRLRPGVERLLREQDAAGRWANRYAYQGKLVADIDRPGKPSRWVTLRACRVLRAVAEAGGASAA
jgi:hypothetical protein